MLGARSVAVVGASPRPGQLRLADGPRGATQSGARASGEPALRPHRRAAVRAVAGGPRRTRRPGAARRAGRRAGSTSSRPPRPPGCTRRRCCSAPRTAGCARRSRRSPTDAGMAVCGAGCMGFVNNATGVRALGYLEPDPLPAGGDLRWSRIRARRSPRCCAPAAASGSGSPSRPGRNSSPTPPTMSSTRSTIPRPALIGAVAGDAAVRPAAAAGAAARRRARRAGGDPHGRRLAARPGDGRRALRGAGR